jgi:hypothetical protein
VLNAQEWAQKRVETLAAAIVVAQPDCRPKRWSEMDQYRGTVNLSQAVQSVNFITV